MVTSQEVLNAQFHNVRFKEGYSINQVDDYLDDITAVLRAYENGSPMSPPKVTAKSVMDKRFIVVRWSKSYQPDEVDDLLDAASETLAAYERQYNVTNPQTGTIQAVSTKPRGPLSRAIPQVSKKSANPQTTSAHSQHPEPVTVANNNTATNINPLLPANFEQESPVAPAAAIAAPVASENQASGNTVEHTAKGERRAQTGLNPALAARLREAKPITGSFPAPLSAPTPIFAPVSTPPTAGTTFLPNQQPAAGQPAAAQPAAGQPAAGQPAAPAFTAQPQAGGSNRSQARAVVGSHFTPGPESALPAAGLSAGIGVNAGTRAAAGVTPAIAPQAPTQKAPAPVAAQAPAPSAQVAPPAPAGQPASAPRVVQGGGANQGRRPLSLRQLLSELQRGLKPTNATQPVPVVLFKDGTVQAVKGVHVTEKAIVIETM